MSQLPKSTTNSPQLDLDKRGKPDQWRTKLGQWRESQEKNENNHSKPRGDMPDLRQSPFPLTVSGSETSELTSHSRAASTARSVAQSIMEEKIDEIYAYMSQGSSTQEVSSLREQVARLTHQLEKATETLANLARATPAIFGKEPGEAITAAQLDNIRAAVHSVRTPQATDEQRKHIEMLWKNLVRLVLEGTKVNIAVGDMKELIVRSQDRFTDTVMERNKNYRERMEAAEKHERKANQEVVRLKKINKETEERNRDLMEQLRTRK